MKYGTDHFTGDITGSLYNKVILPSGTKVIVLSTGPCYTTYLPAATGMGLTKYANKGGVTPKVRATYTVIGHFRKPDGDYIYGIRCAITGQEYIMAPEGLSINKPILLDDSLFED
jgi:hypothetical protein